MRIDEFAKTADGVIGAADRTRFSCVGFDIVATVSTPAAHRTGGDRYIHHGRRPVLPPLPHLPEPQPYVFFETGLTRLTLFVSGKTTLHLKESPKISENLHLVLDSPRQLLTIRDSLEIPLDFSVAAREQYTIRTQLYEYYPVIIREDEHLIIREYGYENPTIKTAGIICPSGDEQIHESLTLHEISHLLFDLEESIKHPIFIHDQIGDCDISQSALMGNAAFAVVSRREEIQESFEIPENLMETIAAAILQLLQEEL